MDEREQEIPLEQGSAHRFTTFRLYLDENEEAFAHEKRVNGIAYRVDAAELSLARRRLDSFSDAITKAEARVENAATDSRFPTEDLRAAAWDERLPVDPDGPTSHWLDGWVDGHEARRYVIAGRAGQELTVYLRSENRFLHFEVLSAGDSVFDAAKAHVPGWSGALPRDGDVAVVVFLSEDEAVRRGSAEFELTIDLR